MNILKLDDVELSDSTTANQVPGWDSLKHTEILFEIERKFNIRFKTMEVLRLKNLGDLQSLIDSKINK